MRVEAKWQQFIGCIRNRDEMTARQIDDMRKLFYSGVAATLSVMDEIAALPTEDAVDAVGGLHAEVRAFTAGIKAAVAARSAAASEDSSEQPAEEV